MEPIRIGQIIGPMRGGGVESVVMNYYRHIDRSRIQFDFIVEDDSTIVPTEEIEKLGGRVFFIPPYRKLYRYIPALTRLLRENKYTIVHAHMNTLCVFPLYAAKQAGVPVRIAHSHSTAGRGETLRNMLKYSLRPFSKVFATHYAACSRLAGEWLFGKRAMEQGKVTIFNNAIDLEKFRFDPAVRDEVRRELGVEDKFVVGHVGRFCYQKNQEFVVDIFAEVYRQNPNAVLLLVGDGKDRAKIEEKVKQMSLWGGVILTGNRCDVDRLYQAMDIFVFPSRYEGLGMGAVEAQMCGVRTVISEVLPDEAKVAPSTVVIELTAGAAAWAEAILKQEKAEPEWKPGKQYDISVQAKKMEAYYRSQCNAKKE